MRLAYAPHGLLGVLTPQANTTVEPEFAILLPPGTAMLNTRLTSPKAEMEARLLDYVEGVEAACAGFANAPLGAYAFACTGASYLAGPTREAELCARVEAARGRPLITAARAVRDALAAIGARRIGLVSPYPPGLTEASGAYWRACGLEVAAVTGAEQPPGAFHPIYAMSAATAEEALAAMPAEGLDAVVMLGTGMPTLAPILAHPHRGRAPVLSCMLALAWRSVTALEGRAPDAASLEGWIGGAGGWDGRYAARMGG